MNLGAELSWLGELSDLAREIITRRQQRAVLEKLEALTPLTLALALTLALTLTPALNLPPTPTPNPNPGQALTRRRALRTVDGAAQRWREVRARRAAAVGVQAQVRGGKARQKTAALKAQRAAATGAAAAAEAAAEAAQREGAATGLQAGVRGGAAWRDVATIRAKKEAG